MPEVADRPAFRVTVRRDGGDGPNAWVANLDGYIARDDDPTQGFFITTEHAHGYSRDEALANLVDLDERARGLTPQSVREHGGEAIPFQYDDGGRQAAGYKGNTDDCVVRAIAIATGTPYAAVYENLHQRTLNDRPQMRKLERKYGDNARSHASPRSGVHRRIYDAYLTDLGWEWTPTTRIGSGTTVHLAADELPGGPLIVRLTRHLAAVIDGVLHDTDDCSRGGTRAVYGFWQPGP